MSKLVVLRELFTDIKYRAGQKGFAIETRFDNERAAIQIVRGKDKAVVYRIVLDVKNNDHKFLRRDVEISQIKAYEHFISYLSFYGIFTIEYSFDEEQRELAEKKLNPLTTEECVEEKPKKKRKKKDESV